jgi:hypothetical protein
MMMIIMLSVLRIKEFYIFANSSREVALYNALEKGKQTLREQNNNDYNTPSLPHPSLCCS